MDVGLYFQPGRATMPSSGSKDICQTRSTQGWVQVISASPAYKEWLESEGTKHVIQSCQPTLEGKIKKEGLCGKYYSVHSLRSGGASAAAAMGVPDRLFQRHGGCRSETVKNNYLKETLNS